MPWIRDFIWGFWLRRKPSGGKIQGIPCDSVLVDNKKAAESLQYEVGAPTEIINIVIGTIVFFVAVMQGVPAILEKVAGRRAHHAE